MTKIGNRKLSKGYVMYAFILLYLFYYGFTVLASAATLIGGKTILKSVKYHNFKKISASCRNATV